MMHAHSDLIKYYYGIKTLTGIVPMKSIYLTWNITHGELWKRCSILHAHIPISVQW